MAYKFINSKNRARKTLIYGSPGIGKTTFVSNIPGIAILDTEQGSKDLVHSVRISTNDFAEINEIIDDIAKDKTRFEQAVPTQESFSLKAIAIDSLSGFEKILTDEICKTARKNDLSDFSYGAGYAKLSASVLTFLEKLDKIIGLEMDVFLVGHETFQEHVTPTEEPYMTIWPLVHKRIRENVFRWCDEVFYVKDRILVDQNKKAKEVKSEGRHLLSDNNPAYLTKKRLAFPEKIVFSATEYLKQRSMLEEKNNGIRRN